jgi:hypothetical protein
MISLFYSGPRNSVDGFALAANRNLIFVLSVLVFFNELKESSPSAIRAPFSVSLQNGGTKPTHHLIAIETFGSLHSSDVFFVANITSNLVAA